MLFWAKVSQARVSVSAKASGLYSRKAKPVAVFFSSVSRVVSVIVSAARPWVAHHRHRSVFQTVELIQATRLKAAGHQEDVRGGFNAMCQIVGEHQPSCHLLWVTLGQRSE